MKYRAQATINTVCRRSWVTLLTDRDQQDVMEVFWRQVADRAGHWIVRWQAKPFWWWGWITQEEKTGTWKPEGGPRMSVKIEVVEPKPVERRFRATGANGAALSFADWTESEAREIYEGLAPHFNGGAWLDTQRLQQLREKDAKIARLKAESAFKDKAVARTVETNRLNYNRAETMQRLNREQVEEIRKLKAEVAELRANPKCCQAEAAELRKWLVRMRAGYTIPTIDRALAGERCPE